VDDVLVALGLRLEGRRGPVDHRSPPDATGRDVLDALGWDAASLEQIAVRTGRSVPELSLALHRLEVDGWLVQSAGWFEQVGHR
jgi:predicted Rossmann fold nucleotide-binding protein DprA/Smf involved in DNA uptake